MSTTSRRLAAPSAGTTCVEEAVRHHGEHGVGVGGHVPTVPARRPGDASYVPLSGLFVPAVEPWFPWFPWLPETPSSP